MKINFLITGAIRPNENCFYYVLEHFKNIFSECEIKVFLSTWDNITNKELLTKKVNFINLNKEPDDSFILENVKERTKQQKELHPHIEGWTTNIYKMFIGFKNMVNYIDENNLLNENDIVVRLRTDTIINFKKKININIIKKILMHRNFIHTNFKNHFSDWFFISTYRIYKQNLLFKDFNEYNYRIKHSYNAEEFLTNNLKKNKVKKYYIPSNGFIISSFENNLKYKKRNIY